MCENRRQTSMSVCSDCVPRVQVSPASDYGGVCQRDACYGHLAWSIRGVAVIGFALSAQCALGRASRVGCLPSVRVYVRLRLSLISDIHALHLRGALLHEASYVSTRACADIQQAFLLRFARQWLLKTTTNADRDCTAIHMTDHVLLHSFHSNDSSELVRWHNS